MVEHSHNSSISFVILKKAFARESFGSVNDQYVSWWACNDAFLRSGSSPRSIPDFLRGCRKDRIPSTVRLRREVHDFTQPRKVHLLFSFRHKSRLPTVVYTPLRDRGNWKPILSYFVQFRNNLYSSWKRMKHKKNKISKEMLNGNTLSRDDNIANSRSWKKEDKYKISGRLRDKRPFELI